ncbi:MAG: hypothetical protein AB7L09_21460 [Nitrospira sp.]
MGKNDRNRSDSSASTEASPESAVAPAPATDSNTADAATTATTAANATATPGTDNRSKMIKDPETGEMVKRVDWIRKMAQPPYSLSRSEITAKVREITGDKNFRYQIVFQATKGLPNLKASDRSKPKAPADAPAGDAQPSAAPSGEAPQVAG